MEQYVFYTSSADATIAFATELAHLLKPSDVITLEGGLGAGKTTFTKGLAKGLGVKRTVNSPTFTIIKEYKGNLPLFHMDVYRLEESDEDLGFDEYFYGEGVTVVEWAKYIKDLLPSERLNINISYETDVTRKIVLEPYGERFIQLCKELRQNEGTSN